MFDQVLEAFGQRGFTAAYGAKQVENLFAFFQTLSGVAEIGDDIFHCFFHAVELGEGRIAFEYFVGKYAA